MINIGIIGVNQGNGHPYSYAAMFNGFDAEALEKHCEYPLIRSYLPINHCNATQIEAATVEYIWTQNRAQSQKIALVSRIPQVLNTLDELIEKSDAIILARDDPWNRTEILSKLIKSKKPFFIDKLISTCENELEAVLDYAETTNLVLATSPARYLHKVTNNSFSGSLHLLNSIHGVSRVNWMRYGSHILDPIIAILGVNDCKVRNLSFKSDHDIIQIQYNKKVNIVIECINELNLPIETNYYFSGLEKKRIYFDDFYNSFNLMMREFVNMIEGNYLPISVREMRFINNIILAGIKSDGEYINVV